MKIRLIPAAVASLLALTAHAAPVKYDDFNVTTGIDRVKWSESEAARYIDGNKLTLGRFLYGNTLSDTGLTMESWNMSVPILAPVKGLRADLTIDDIKQDESCAANTSVGISSARLLGSFFNIRPGGPVPGDRTGDVLAQVRARRTSNSVDAPGVLQVQGVLSQCTVADCSASAALPGVPLVVSLGSVTPGTPMRLQFAWDKKTNTFTYTRDGAITATITYTQDDSVAPVAVFANVSLRNEIQNCLTQRIKGGIVGIFDNVYVTQ
ncbi:hypothetical protein KAK06_04325 [Ideonella sp. 4Y11]|uniref:Uncharacterized protein n=1 Tax=Ideonella aquatica TaxID=2824119 RepID=A0A940YI04_9BURK|nr:hypothetical protein [Ideonella aquatica]MBQ0958174.1 hypothetical protein [Ideonella aquatica]